MSSKLVVSTFLIFVLSLGADAQRWKKYRQEINGGLGATWFLCDVGGYTDQPTNSIADMNFKSTSWGIYAGYNYYFTKNISIQGQFTYGWLQAKDIHAGNEARRHRNFDIRTHLYELGVLGRYYIIREKFGHAFRMKGTQNGLLYGLSAYATGGLIGLYFNPTGSHPGTTKYTPLYDIGTEGQTVQNSGVEKYSRITYGFALGGGIKYALGTRLNIGVEYMFRKTFSDYVDDVSGVYYDNNKIITANNGNQEAGLLADPSIKTVDNATWTDPGERRGGGNQDDWYQTIMITVGYKLLKGKTFKPRF